MLCCVRARTGSRLRRQPMAVGCGLLTERASCGGRLCAAARAAPLGVAWRARARRASLALDCAVALNAMMIAIQGDVEGDGMRRRCAYLLGTQVPFLILWAAESGVKVLIA